MPDLATVDTPIHPWLRLAARMGGAARLRVVEALARSRRRDVLASRAVHQAARSQGARRAVARLRLLAARRQGLHALAAAAGDRAAPDLPRPGGPC